LNDLSATGKGGGLIEDEAVLEVAGGSQWKSISYIQARANRSYVSSGEPTVKEVDSRIPMEKGHMLHQHDQG